MPPLAEFSLIWPDPIEPVFDEAIQDGFVDVGERELLAGFTGQMLEPDARMELEEHWVSHSGHACCLLYTLLARLMPTFGNYRFE